MAWTEKMVEDLKIMWKQGLTTGEIGKRLGVSKNSIVGKVHRLQLDARPSPIKKKEEEVSDSAAAEKKTAVKSKSEKKPQPKAEPTPTAAPAPLPIKAASSAGNTSGEVRLTDLDNHTCRWPLGDPKDENFHFCGKKVKIGQTYCEEHAALAYVKPTKK